MTHKLLTTKEQLHCKKIVETGARLASQRAKALLVLNDGATRAQAAESSGLTLGQIRYLVTSFNRKRLTIFPEPETIPAATEKPVSVIDEKKEKKAKKVKNKEAKKKKKKEKKKEKTDNKKLKKKKDKKKKKSKKK